MDNIGLLIFILLIGIAHNSNGECVIPINFPPSIPFKTSTFQNWAIALTVSNLWTAIPSSPQDVVTLANWGLANGFRLRASGEMHNWSPLTVTEEIGSGPCPPNILLVKTSNNLNSMRMKSTIFNAASVTVQTGAMMEDLLSFLEENGFGFFAVPAPGDVTVGGVLAIGGHGTGIGSGGTTGQVGSLSNSVLSFTAVVWSSNLKAYSLKTFQRNDSAASTFLVNLGRAFLIEVTLRVAPNQNLRCESRIDISTSQLFSPNPSINSVSYFLSTSRRVEIIWFPFTSFPWLKVWTVSPSRPFLSRLVTSPYNYPFSDLIPSLVSAIVGNLTSGNWFLAPAFGLAQLTVTASGLLTTFSQDIWGPSKNVLLYVKPTTLRYTANGYTIITSINNVQNVIYTFTNFYQELLETWKVQGMYPINGPLEIRITGLDNVEDVGVPGAELPILSATSPQGSFDTAVWFDFLTFPFTPNSSDFLSLVETYLLTTFQNGETSIIRPEWSKGWAFTGAGPWTNISILKQFIPSSYPKWNNAVNTLNFYDPHSIFTNNFLSKLLVPFT